MIQCKQIFYLCNLFSQQEPTRLNLPFIWWTSSSEQLPHQTGLSYHRSHQVPHHCPLLVTRRSSVKGQVCQVPRCVQDTHLITTDHRLLILCHERNSTLYDLTFLHLYITGLWTKKEIGGASLKGSLLCIFNSVSSDEWIRVCATYRPVPLVLIELLVCP